MRNDMVQTGNNEFDPGCFESPDEDLTGIEAKEYSRMFIEEAAPMDEQEASKLLRAVGNVRRRSGNKTAPLKAEIERLQDRVAEIEASADDQVAWLEARLELWHRARLLEDSTRKSIELPGGKLKSRATQPKAVVDSFLFDQWVEKVVQDLEVGLLNELPSWVTKQVTYKPNKAEITRLYKADGWKTQSFVEIEPAGRNFTAEPA